MSEPEDSKEPETVRLPSDPPMDMRHGNEEPLDEDAPIQAKDMDWAYNSEPSWSQEESTPEADPDTATGSDEE